MPNKNNESTRLENLIDALSDEDKQILEQLLKKVNILSEIVEERERGNNALDFFKKKEIKLDPQFKIS